MLSTFFDRRSALELLKSKHIAFNVESEKGGTALHMASRCNVEVIKRLCEVSERSERALFEDENTRDESREMATNTMASSTTELT